MPTGLEAYLAGIGASARDLPKIAGTYSGRLVICADAACLWDDLERLGCRNDRGRGSVYAPQTDFMVVNKAGECFPGNIEHWYSNIPRVIAAAVAARRDEYRREFEGPKHTHACNRGAKWLWPWQGRGTSGLGATLTGVALGYDEIVLCGMPLDGGPHNGEPPWRKTGFLAEASDQIDGRPNVAWLKAMPHFGGKVRSMSGRTREWLSS